ncbi:hypothetical protein HELRODRAFT_180269 [Helobdella robusta]|uniref:Uncharacterized protein n=1 Tax=Helobdella robusta TaxID=6412 RepID=T1FFN4_HELRO|nr:hypothetical protein HELRODRAFT_180269 [Helobdella robusta]ESN94100.1 hypothetical protein HELRODRAFT_180269 [Helobdella robusta]
MTDHHSKCQPEAYTLRASYKGRLDNFSISAIKPDQSVIVTLCVGTLNYSSVSKDVWFDSWLRPSVEDVSLSIRYDTIQSDTIQSDPIQHDTIRYDTSHVDGRLRHGNTETLFIP